jgi:UDP-glucuronate 4-epimerase
MPAMRALVTGGAGFIGSSVVDRLLAEGFRVAALDNFDPYYDPAQKRRNVARALKNERYQLVEADVRDAAALDAAFDQARPDVVVHLAAKAGVRSSVEDARSYVQVNELGGFNVLEACRLRDRLPLVFASTSSVYGKDAEPPFRETDPATSPLSPYAASKRAAELMVMAYHHVHEQPAALLRFFTVYGPRGRPDMAFWKFTRALRTGGVIRLHGETTERDFTYVDDIVEGVWGAVKWALEHSGTGGRQCEVFNLGRSEPVRVRDLVERLAAELGTTPNITVVPLELGEAQRTGADVSRARAAFGYAPKVGLHEGIRRWVEWVDRSDEADPLLRVTNP